MLSDAVGVLRHREPVHWPGVVYYAEVCELLKGLHVEVEDLFWTEVVHDCIDIMLAGVERACSAARL